MTSGTSRIPIVAWCWKSRGHLFEREHLEVLTFSFPEVGADQATIRFHWGTTALDIPVRVKMGLRGRPTR